MNSKRYVIPLHLSPLSKGTKLCQYLSMPNRRAWAHDFKWQPPGLRLCREVIGKLTDAFSCRCPSSDRSKDWPQVQTEVWQLHALQDVKQMCAALYDSRSTQSVHWCFQTPSLLMAILRLCRQVSTVLPIMALSSSHRASAPSMQSLFRPCLLWLVQLISCNEQLTLSTFGLCWPPPLHWPDLLTDI